MATPGTKGQDTLANKVDTALSNAADPTISARLARLGLNQAALDEGRAKLDAALTGQRHQNTSRASYHDAVDRVNESAAALKMGMTGISATARRVAADMPDALKSLQLDRGSNRKKALLLGQYQNFRRNRERHPEVMDRIRPYWSNEQIADLDAASDTLRQNLLRQEALKGDSQQATRDLAAATKLLRAWYSSFCRIARAALKDKPDLLEKLGLFARAAPRRKAAPASGDPAQPPA